MTWDRIEGHWKQVTGRAQQSWGRLTDDDLDLDVDVVAGRREQLAGEIQEHYGVAREDAGRQIGERQRKASDAWSVIED
jgi:uncharacterized protein YjbJ (UPF0337 family)